MSGKSEGDGVQESRRAVVKKLAYVAPIVLSLKASPSFAKPGSSKKDKDR
jgi:hypothetical protein